MDILIGAVAGLLAISLINGGGMLDLLVMLTGAIFGVALCLLKHWLERYF
jgi:hypothetical protein